MQVQVSTRARLTGRGAPEIIMRIILLPRGSGNRNRSQQLAKGFKNHQKLKPFIKRVAVGTSSITVHMKLCLGLNEAINEVLHEQKLNQDVPGQLPLFA